MSTSPSRLRQRREAVASALLALALVPVGIAIAADPVVPVTPGAAAAATPGTSSTPTVGATTAPAAAAVSAFKLDRAASQPLGLAPNGVTDPLNYPNEPVILRWTAVPGAASYTVEIATTSGFAKVLWKGETDQPLVAPTTLLPDGDYWWRVTATDGATTRGLTSDVARFAKRWPNSVSGLVTASSPGGRAVSQVALHPYFTWKPVPGATNYDVEVAAGDRFATPAYTSTNFPLTFTSPSAVGALPDDSYSWRVRAKDLNSQPGPWSPYSAFTKVWATPNPTAPVDDASLQTPLLRWDPVEGAEGYQVQISVDPFTFTGDRVLINQETANTAWGPLYADTLKGFSPGANFFWRVRPFVDGTYGGWTTTRHLYWEIPSSSAAAITLDPVADIDASLPPVFSWNQMPGANLYRVDVATDLAFHNIIVQEFTVDGAFTPSKPLPDNQTGTGYFWRVVWGSGSPSSHILFVDENSVPVGTFKKQTRFTLGQGAATSVTQPPLLSWAPVTGAGKYDLEISRDPQFLVPTLAGVGGTVYGLGLVPTNINNAPRLADGSWFWRVRVKDASGNGQSWSQAGSFALVTDRPDQTLPADDETVPGAPLLRWTPVQTACGYDIQIASQPTITDDTAVLETSQTAFALTGTDVPTAGRWYWRVRADMCNQITSQWSPTRSFISVRPPDFGLQTLPRTVIYGRSVIVAGKLQFGGRAVRSPKLIVERKEGRDSKFRGYGTIQGDARGRYAFRMRPKGSAAYRLRWDAEKSHPAGETQFTVKVSPRVTARLLGARVLRKGMVKVSGSVFPIRPVRVQVLSDGNWTTLAKYTPKSARFKVTARASVAPGRYQLRILVPGDLRLAQAATSQRALLIYDKFIVSKGSK